MSVHRLKSGSTGKYQHSVLGVPLDCSLMLVFSCSPLLSSRYRHTIQLKKNDYMPLLFKYLSLYQRYFVRHIQFLLEHILRNANSTYMSQGLYQPVPSLWMVLAHTSPMPCTVEYTLLSICSENVQNAWSVSSLSHLQTSSGKSFSQDAFGQGLCDALQYCQPLESLKFIKHTYINWSPQNFEKPIYIARTSAIQRPQLKALQDATISRH